MDRIIDYENLSDKIQEWILTYTVEHKITTLVVGVSGGIDSAVVSTLCAKTGLPTLVIGMPLNSSESNTELSNKHISFLCEKYKNVNGYTIDLSKTFQEFKSNVLFEKEFNSPSFRAACSNNLLIIWSSQIQELFIRLGIKRA